MAELRIHLKGLTCHNCVNHVTEELMELKGIKAVNIDLDKEGVSVAHVEYDPCETPSEEAIKEAIEEAGDYVLTQISI